MADDILTAWERWRAGDARAWFDVEEMVLPAVQEILGHIRRTLDARLQSGIDGVGIADVASRRLLAGVSRNDSGCRSDSDTVTTILDTVVGVFLSERSDRDTEIRWADAAGIFRKDDNVEASLDSTGANAMHSLAVWIKWLYSGMRGVHPKAIEILSLRAQGYEVREIAQRLDMGRWLIKRIINDIRTSLDKTSGLLEMSTARE